MIKIFLVFLGIIMILIGYYEMPKPTQNDKPIKDEYNTSLDVFKNAGVGSSEDILKQKSTYENLFEQKPGEIYDNIFNGEIIGLLSS